MAELNARFRRAVSGDGAAALPHAGVLLSQVDGHRQAGAAWLPSPADVVRGFMSTSLIFADLARSFPSIPLFAYDSGVVLRPSAVQVLCLYGADASTDQSHACGASQAPGGWCTRADLPADLDPHATFACGFDYLRGWRSGLNPWHVADAGPVLAYQSLRGHGNATAPFTGYNEIITAPWDASAIEAFFVVDCARDEANHDFQAHWQNERVAATCAEAHAVGHAARDAFVAAHGLVNESFPLLVLRRGEWTEPFAPLV